MSMAKVATASVMALGIAAAMAACSSSSGGSGPGGGTGPCGSGGPGGSQTNQACDSCTQSKCSSEFNACFGGSGSCSAWVNAGCNGVPDQTCLTCTDTMESCQKSSCATECKLTTTNDSGAPDFGSFDSGTPTTPNCVSLETCCNDPSFPAAAKTGCLYVAGANDDASCQSDLSTFKSAGYCK